MKNKITDLNNHLFAQIERLSDEDLSDEGIEKEVRRAEAIVGLSDQVMKAATIQLKAAQLAAEYGRDFQPYLPLLGKET